MLKSENERLKDFRRYGVDETFIDIFEEFIYELDCVDLSEKTLDNLYGVFIKDMINYFDKK